MILERTSASLHRIAIYIAILSCIVLIVSPACARKTVSAADPNAQRELNDLTTSLANGSIATIDILHMPDRVETRASVSPDNLERWFDCRVTINKISEWSGRNELVQTMKSSTVTQENRMPDMRSAVIFYGSDGHRIGALYFGRYFGRYLGQFDGAQGAIGNTPVSFKGNMSVWLKQMIPSALQ